jgi:hypothetical protein
MRDISMTLSTATVVILCSVFLVGARLEASWAGGHGRVEACPATNLGTGLVIPRGGVLASTADEFAKFELCDGSTFYLDKNTQLRLDRYFVSPAQPTQLTLLQGRVIVDGVVDVKTRNLTFAASSGCELVHYSWLDQVDLTPLADQSCIMVNPPTNLLVANYTYKYNTFDGSVISTTTYEPAESSAKSFYDWTGLELKGL